MLCSDLNKFTQESNTEWIHWGLYIAYKYITANTKKRGYKSMDTEVGRGSKRHRGVEIMQMHDSCA